MVKTRILHNRSSYVILAKVLISIKDKYALWHAADVWARDIHKAKQDLIPLAVEDAAEVLRYYAEIELEANELIDRGDYEQGFARLLNIRKRSPEQLVRINLERRDGERVRDKRSAIFRDRNSMIQIIVADVSHLHSVRTGEIGGKNASVVLAERLSRLETPELMLFCGYLFDKSQRGGAANVGLMPWGAQQHD